MLNKDELTIEQLNIENFRKCQNIWDMKKQSGKAKQFLYQLKRGNRITFICKNADGDFLGEGSLVFDTHNDGSTIPGKRVFLSHLEVKPECRNQGIGTMICNHIFDYCKNEGYEEITLSVLMSNYGAVKLYQKMDFSTLLYVKEDHEGRHLGLLKKLV